jgi:hypothetical protein
MSKNSIFEQKFDFEQNSIFKKITKCPKFSNSNEAPKIGKRTHALTARTLAIPVTGSGSIPPGSKISF